MSTMQTARRIVRSTTIGGAAACYVAGRTLLGNWPRADRNFFRSAVGSTETLELPTGEEVPLPALYFREDSFRGLFSAAYDPVRDLLPSDRLYPVVLPGGRAAVMVWALNYIDTSFGLPYGEIAVAPVCTLDRQVPWPVALLLESRLPDFGGFILHLPVTARLARDGGRLGWGYAKFVADMDFTRRPDYQSVHLAEGGAHILTLTVKRRGPLIRDNRPIVTYSVLGDDLIRATLPSRAVYQLGLRPGTGTLELGDHEIADRLRHLDLSRQSLATQNYLSRSGILIRGESVGPADRPHPGYTGRETEFGRLTVSYDSTVEPVDVYAGLRQAETRAR